MSTCLRYWLDSPYDDPQLQISTGDASQSPFTIAFQRSGVSVVPSIINAVVCTSALSAGSACVFIASRTLYGLSCDGHAPQVMQRCNRFGVPYYAVALTCLPLPLVYLAVSNSASVVFGWFINITTLAGMIGWIVIEITYIRFYNALKQQGYSRNGMSPPVTIDMSGRLLTPRTELPYKGPLQPYISYFTLVLISLIVIFSGFDVFVKSNFTAAGFVTCYLNVAIFAVLYIFFKVALKSKVLKLSEIDFQTEFDKINEERRKEAAEMQMDASDGTFTRMYRKIRRVLARRS